MRCRKYSDVYPENDKSRLAVSAVLDDQGRTDEAVADLSLDTHTLSESLRKAQRPAEN